MRTRPIKFAGYAPGVTDFATIEPNAPADDRFRIQQLIVRLVDNVMHPEGSGSTSVTVVGHADREDNPELTCDQRRQSEADAAMSRAVSAWEWTLAQVNKRLAAAGQQPPEQWWETNSAVTWALVFAGTGQLEFPLPSPEQRALNRRVVFLVGTADGGL